MPSATVARTVADHCRKAPFKATNPESFRGLHGADFHLKTGAVVGPPAPKAFGVPSYKVVVESDDIKVEV